MPRWRSAAMPSIVSVSVHGPSGRLSSAVSRRGEDQRECRQDKRQGQAGAAQHIPHAQAGEDLDREDDGEQQQIDRPGAERRERDRQDERHRQDELDPPVERVDRAGQRAVGIEEVDVHRKPIGAPHQARTWGAAPHSLRGLRAWPCRSGAGRPLPAPRRRPCSAPTIPGQDRRQRLVRDAGEDVVRDQPEERTAGGLQEALLLGDPLQPIGVSGGQRARARPGARQSRGRTPRCQRLPWPQRVRR